MSFKSRTVDKTFPALVTRERPQARVNLRVHSQRPLVHKKLVAYLALERLLESMQFLVKKHVALFAECIPAHATRERLFARVNSHMPDKRILLEEVHVTNVTLELFHVQVKRHVCLEPGLAVESLFAHVALEFEEVRVFLVGLEVNVKITLVTVRLAAHFAHVWLFARVNSHVTSQVVPQFELLLAEVADKTLLFGGICRFGALSFDPRLVIRVRWHCLRSQGVDGIVGWQGHRELAHVYATQI